MRIAARALFVFALATAVFFHLNLGDQNRFAHLFQNIAITGGLRNIIVFCGARAYLTAEHA